MSKREFELPSIPYGTYGYGRIVAKLDKERWEKILKNTEFPIPLTVEFNAGKVVGVVEGVRVEDDGAIIYGSLNPGFAHEDLFEYAVPNVAADAFEDDDFTARPSAIFREFGLTNNPAQPIDKDD
jgi:hypothetical protein